MRSRRSRPGRGRRPGSCPRAVRGGPGAEGCDERRPVAAPSVRAALTTSRVYGGEGDAGVGDEQGQAGDGGGDDRALPGEGEVVPKSSASYQWRRGWRGPGRPAGRSPARSAADSGRMVSASQNGRPDRRRRRDSGRAMSRPSRTLNTVAHPATRSDSQSGDRSCVHSGGGPRTSVTVTAAIPCTQRAALTSPGTNSSTGPASGQRFPIAVPR